MRQQEIVVKTSLDYISTVIELPESPTQVLSYSNLRVNEKTLRWRWEVTVISKPKILVGVIRVWLRS